MIAVLEFVKLYPMEAGVALGALTLSALLILEGIARVFRAARGRR